MSSKPIIGRIYSTPDVHAFEAARLFLDSGLIFQLNRLGGYSMFIVEFIDRVTADAFNHLPTMTYVGEVI